MTRYRRMNFSENRKGSGINGYTVFLCLIVSLILIWAGVVKL